MRNIVEKHLAGDSTGDVQHSGKISDKQFLVSHVVPLQSVVLNVREMKLSVLPTLNSNYPHHNTQQCSNLVALIVTLKLHISLD